MENANQASEFLTTAELCAEWRIDRKGLYRLITEHGLPRYKIGTRNRFRRSDLEEFLQQHRIGPSQVDDFEQFGAARRSRIASDAKRKSVQA